MDFIDNLLQTFSAKDLRSRVLAVILGGFAVIIIASVAMYFLLASKQQIAVSGIGHWPEGNENTLVVSLDQQDLALLGDVEYLKVIIMDRGHGPIVIETTVISVNPSTPSVTIDAFDFPQDLRGQESMDVKLILVDRHMWQLLWQK
jgi:hypothetical protein